MLFNSSLGLGVPSSIRLLMIYSAVVRMEYNNVYKNFFANDKVLIRSFSDNKSSIPKALLPFY